MCSHWGWNWSFPPMTTWKFPTHWRCSKVIQFPHCQLAICDLWINCSSVTKNCFPGCCNVSVTKSADISGFIRIKSCLFGLFWDQEIFKKSSGRDSEWAESEPPYWKEDGSLFNFPLNWIPGMDNSLVRNKLLLFSKLKLFSNQNFIQDYKCVQFNLHNCIGFCFKK